MDCMIFKIGNSRSYFRILPWIVILLSGVCQGEANCPWLNAATAGGVLGGAVNVTVTNTNKTSDDATCYFSRQSLQVVDALQIRVITMRDPAKEFASYKEPCGANANPLKAIGNEAIECSLEGKAGQYAQQVIGRVRNRAFIVNLGTSMRNDPVMTPDSMRAKVRSVAEQVTGNLF